MTTADSLTRAVGNPKAKSMQYYSAHRKTEHCKYMSRKTIAFWAMETLTFCAYRISITKVARRTFFDDSNRRYVYFVAPCLKEGKQIVWKACQIMEVLI